MTDDKNLIEGFLTGDPESTRTLVAWSRSVALHQAWESSAWAEDCVADTILKLLMLLREGSFRGDSSLKTFVCRITRYTAIDMMRHRRRTLDLLTAENVPLPSSADPEQEFLEREQAYLFRRIVSLLGEKCRQLWDLVFAQALPYKEIAEREGVTVTTVKMRMFHCKEEAVALKKKLETGIPGGA